MKQYLMKNNKGFTLVEVIVVAVIVAVLAAVAIPLYIGYINDSAVNQANNEAASFATAVANGLNSGFSGAPTNGAATITGPITVTWPVANFPAGWAGVTAPTYRVATGVTLNTNNVWTAGGGTVTATVRTKTGNQYTW